MSVNLAGQGRSKTFPIKAKTLGERTVSTNNDDKGNMDKKIGDDAVQKESNTEDRTGSYLNNSRMCQIPGLSGEDDRGEASPTEVRGPDRRNPLIKGGDRGVYTSARTGLEVLQGGKDTDSEVGPRTIGMKSIILGRMQSTDQIDRGR